MKEIVDNIYQFKTEMMGAAILMIVAFHTILPPDTPGFILDVKRFGEVGVDIFLFLGGFTVAGSFMRSTSLMSFYKKRLVRILPAYLFIWGGIHLVFNLRYSEGLLSYLENLSLWRCVFYNDLRNWYVAAVLLCYFLTPFYMKLCTWRKFFFLLPLFLMVLGFILMALGLFKQLPFFMFGLRLPIYLLGIVCFMLKDNDCKISQSWLVLLTLLSVVMSQLVIEFHITESPFELRRYFYIPLVVCFIKLWKFKSSFLNFLGTITLEIYLLHEVIQGLFFDLLSPPPYIYITSSVLLSLLIGYYVHILIKRVTDCFS